MEKIIDQAHLDTFYGKAMDPWQVKQQPSVHLLISQILEKYVSHTSQICDLGCGEGTLTAIMAKHTGNVRGYDLSQVAIDRALAQEIIGAKFQQADVTKLNLRGYGAIFMTECLYHITPASARQEFLNRIIAEHSGIFVVSGNMSGGTYLDHESLSRTLTTPRSSIMEQRNYGLTEFTPKWLRGIVQRLPISMRLLAYDFLPDVFAQHRYYVVRIS